MSQAEAGRTASRSDVDSRSPPRRIVFAPSHFCERARWALDRASLDYREERWAPGPHAYLAKRLGLPSTATPILDRGGGALVQGSDAILDWTGLAGGDAELERRFQQRIGPLVRQYVYAALLNDPRSGALAMLMDGVPRIQALVARLLWPGTRRRIVRGLNAQAERLPELADRVAAELAWFDGVLGARGEHLAGDAFGRADLTAASLLSPIAEPAEHPMCKLYARLSMPPAVRDAIATWSGRPSLTWVHAVYAKHRNEREPASGAASA